MRRKIGVLMLSAVLAATLMTGCAAPAAQPQAPAAAETEAAATEAAEEETAAETAEAEAAEEAAAEAEETEAAEPEIQTYESADGWSVRYDPALFTVNESDEGVGFVYTGEAAGTSMVTISTVADKQPEEVLYDVTSPWGADEKLLRVEGFFPGTEDKWGYWRILNPEEEGSGLSETAIAGEYNGGVLLFDILTHMGGDDAVDVPMNDAIAELVNSITYENFGPQEMYACIPGTYVQENGSLTLNEDHTGTLSLEEDAEVLWASTELIAADGSFHYEYTVEGSDILVNTGDSWITFSKEGAEETADEAAAEEDAYPGLWAEKSAERIVLSLFPSNEEGWYDAEITWREDLPQKDVYDMRAQLQEDGSLYYDNCRYVIRTFEGDSFTDEIQYESGSGLFYYDEDAGELYWTDYEVDPQENVTTFIRAAFEEEEEAADGE